MRHMRTLSCSRDCASSLLPCQTDAGQAVVEAEEQREAEADQGWHSTPQWPSPIARLRERGDLTPVREGSSVAEVSKLPAVFDSAQDKMT